MRSERQGRILPTFSALLAEGRPLRSFVAEARRDGREVIEIACVTPAETAADKLSALTLKLEFLELISQGQLWPETV